MVFGTRNCWGSTSHAPDAVRRVQTEPWQETKAEDVQKIEAPPCYGMM